MSLVTLGCAKGHISRRVFLTDSLPIKFHCSFWKPSLRSILSSEVTAANMYLKCNDKKPQLWPHKVPGPINCSSELNPLPLTLFFPFSQRHVFVVIMKLIMVVGIYWGTSVCQATYLTLMRFPPEALIYSFMSQKPAFGNVGPWSDLELWSLFSVPLRKPPYPLVLCLAHFVRW